MKFLKTTIFLLLNVISISSFCQVRSSSSNFELIPKKGEIAPKKIELKLFNNESGDYGNNILLFKKKSNGNFVVSAPLTHPITPFMMFFYFEGRIEHSDIYYTQPSDNVKINLKLDNSKVRLLFSGAGSLKYKIKDTLSQISKAVYSKEVKIYVDKYGIYDPNLKGKLGSEEYYKSDDFKEYINGLTMRIASNTLTFQNVLSKYKVQLGKDVAIFYNYELNCSHYFLFFINQLFCRSTTTSAKLAIADFYFSKAETFKPAVPQDTLVKLAIAYKSRKSSEIMLETWFRNKGLNYSIDKQYNTIKNINNPALRNILITQFLLEPKFRIYVLDNIKKDSCINDALKFIQSPELRNPLINERSLFTRGANVPDFSFADTLGNYVGLKELKGKVFLLDFYFKGCWACSVFSKRFEKEIYPEFETNPNFKVLSVSIDEKRERWIQGMKDGYYTMRGGINLNTGVGFNHPIMTHYNVQKIPFVLLVDQNGKLIARLDAADMESPQVSKMIRDELFRTKMNTP